jgi:hypothetical protein
MLVDWKDPDKLRIRVRIQEAKKDTDPMDPNPDADPEHWNFLNFFSFLWAILLTGTC